jgi:hypothetical protein
MSAVPIRISANSPKPETFKLSLERLLGLSGAVADASAIDRSHEKSGGSSSRPRRYLCAMFSDASSIRFDRNIVIFHCKINVMIDFI